MNELAKSYGYKSQDTTKMSGKALIGYLSDLYAKLGNLSAERELARHFQEIDRVKKEILSRLGE